MVRNSLKLSEIMLNNLKQYQTVRNNLKQSAIARVCSRTIKDQTKQQKEDMVKQGPNGRHLTCIPLLSDSKGVLIYEARILLHCLNLCIRVLTTYVRSHGGLCCHNTRTISAYQCAWVRIRERISPTLKNSKARK